MTQATSTGATGGPLAGLRVLEISHRAAAVAGQVLADLGADVVKIEPEGGEPSRFVEPAFKGADGSATSYFWLSYNSGKRSVVVDLASDAGLADFERLAADADIVVTDFERLSLAECDRLAEVAERANPAVVWTEVLPFGRGKPYEDYPATDTVLQALGGHLSLNGDAYRPPVRISAPVGLIQGGVEAASAATMAYYHRLMTGEGQRVDVSIQECIIWTLLNSTMLWQILGFNEFRGGAVRRERANRFFTRVVWPAKDGHVFFGPVGGGGGSAREKSYAALLAWMKEDGIEDDILTSRDWNGEGQFAISQEDYDTVSDVIKAFIETKTTKELITRAVADRILLAPISSVRDIFENPHFRARGLFEPLADDRLGLDVEVPSRWIRMSATPLRGPAAFPVPGADQEAYLGAPAAARMKEGGARVR